jgi:hypothetical protein
MNRHFFPVAIMAAVLCGCGKHSEQPAPTQPASVSADSAASQQPGEPTAPPSSAQPTPAASAPAPAATTPAAAPSNANTEAALATLTQAVRKYSFEQRRMPKSLQEVISAGYISPMPQAPPGKKFVLDAKNVQVVLQ